MSKSTGMCGVDTMLNTTEYLLNIGCLIVLLFFILLYISGVVCAFGVVLYVIYLLLGG